MIVSDMLLLVVINVWEGYSSVYMKLLSSNVARKIVIHCTLEGED